MGRGTLVCDIQCIKFISGLLTMTWQSRNQRAVTAAQGTRMKRSLERDSTCDKITFPRVWRRPVHVLDFRSVSAQVQVASNLQPNWEIFKQLSSHKCHPLCGAYTAVMPVKSSTVDYQLSSFVMCRVIPIVLFGLSPFPMTIPTRSLYIPQAYSYSHVTSLGTYVRVER